MSKFASEFRKSIRIGNVLTDKGKADALSLFLAGEVLELK